MRKRLFVLIDFEGDLIPERNAMSSPVSNRWNIQVAFWGIGARMREKGQGQMVSMEGFSVAVFPADARMGFLKLGV